MVNIVGSGSPGPFQVETSNADPEPQQIGLDRNTDFIKNL